MVATTGENTVSPPQNLTSTDANSSSEGVKAKVYIRAAPRTVQGRKYLTLQQIKMDFSVKDIRMGVENVHGGNSVLRKFWKLVIDKMIACFYRGGA